MTRTQRLSPVERRLRSDAHGAFVTPSAALRRRTLDALREADLEGRPAARRAGSPILSYGLACGFLFLIGLAAVSWHNEPVRIAPAPGPAAGRVNFTLFRLGSTPLGDTVRAASWDEPLRNEARLLASDAIAAGQVLLAQLPKFETRN